MIAPNDRDRSLLTPDGPVTLREYRLRAAGRQWTILHTEALFTVADETRFFRESRERLPYGVALWPAAIALAHDLAARPEVTRGCRVLELGAGTGLPGIVAAALGGWVVQTDRHDLALSLCRRNGEHNGARSIAYRLVDWTEWDDDDRYELILGADILYGESQHPYLRRILERNLAPRGRALLADPFRATSLGLLDSLEADGWTITVSTWRVGEEADPRTIGVFEVARPA